MYTAEKISTCPDRKNHLRNHKSLCALGQHLHAPGMRARLNVEPCCMESQDHNELTLLMLEIEYIGLGGSIMSTPYMVLPLFATRFAAYAGGNQVSFTQPRLF